MKTLNIRPYKYRQNTSELYYGTKYLCLIHYDENTKQLTISKTPPLKVDIL